MYFHAMALDNSTELHGGNPT